MVSASEVVPSSADAVAGCAHQQGDKAEKQDDEPDRPDDPDPAEDTDDEKDDSGDDHHGSIAALLLFRGLQLADVGRLGPAVAGTAGLTVRGAGNPHLPGEGRDVLGP
jgi:hypothetical protein